MGNQIMNHTCTCTLGQVVGGTVSQEVGGALGQEVGGA